jgi:hypothetical protein
VGQSCAIPALLSNPNSRVALRPCHRLELQTNLI